MREKRLGRLAQIVAVSVLTAGLAMTASANQRFITIGTGGVTGVYYPAGGAICRLVNQDRASHGIRCSAESTGGSVFNVNTIAQGELDFGVVQSDVQFNKLNGLAQFADQGPDEEMRSVFSLHPEPLTAVVRADSGISGLQDLKGKRVNVGNPGSGQRAAVEVLMDRLGWSMSDFALASELPSREQAQALCDDRIDAFLFTVGHPTGSIAEPVATCNAQLVSLAGPEIDALVDETPFYFHATIPAGMYNNAEDIQTYGVGATIVSSTRTDADAVYVVTRAIFENLDAFRGLHPALGVLNAESMATQGLSAPIHEGAMRYFQEVGLH